MFKLKQRKRLPEELSTEYTYKGAEAMTIVPGAILKVLSSSVSNQGDHIITTGDRNRPFRNLQYNAINGIGSSWGTTLSGYFFQIIPYAKVEDYPEYLEILKKEAEKDENQ